MPLQREFFTRKDLVWGAGACEQEKVVSYVVKDNEARQPTLQNIQWRAFENRNVLHGKTIILFIEQKKNTIGRYFKLQIAILM